MKTTRNSKSKNENLKLKKEKVRDLTVSTNLRAGLFMCHACPPSATAK